MINGNMIKVNNRKLSNYIVDRDLQFRFLASSLIFMLIAVIAVLAIVLLPLVMGMFSADLDIQYRSAQDFLIIIKKLVPAIILLFLFFSLHQLTATHRIFGPLVNFCHTFSSIKEGNLMRPVHLRQGDCLKKECDKINDMIDGLSQLVAKASNDQKKLISDLENIISRTGDLKTKEELEAALKIVMVDARYVMDPLSQFQVKNDSSDSPTPESTG